MADSRCCFGCSNVRKGAWIIAIFDMVVCVLFTIRIIFSLNISTNLYKKPHSHNSALREETFNFNYDRHYQMENDFIIFNQLFVLFLFFYVNLNLKKATYVHNTQSINQWLVTNSIFLIFFLLYIVFSTVKNSTPELLPIGLPISIVVMYQRYVVKCFYEDELKFLNASEHNVVTQPTLHGTSYVTINSQMQTPTYPVQAGPYVIQQMHQPITQAPYPQQTYQFEPQQQPCQSRVILPPSETHTAQEYCNPPPYSPNYNTQEVSSVKH